MVNGYQFAFTTAGPGGGSDTIPPEIQHDPVKGAPAGKDVVIRATVSDANGVADGFVKVYFRKVGTAAFSPWRMELVSGDWRSGTFQGYVVKDAMSGEGAEYYIEARDVRGNTAYHPAAGPAKPHRIGIDTGSGGYAGMLIVGGAVAVVAAVSAALVLLVRRRRRGAVAEPPPPTFFDPHDLRMAPPVRAPAPAPAPRPRPPPDHPTPPPPPTESAVRPPPPGAPGRPREVQAEWSVVASDEVPGR
jgi:hypothetical protein